MNFLSIYVTLWLRNVIIVILDYHSRILEFFLLVTSCIIEYVIWYFSTRLKHVLPENLISNSQETSSSLSSSVVPYCQLCVAHIHPQLRTKVIVWI